MAKKGWSRSFDEPIPLPDGRVLRTLRDGGNYIAALPKQEHDAPEWQAAIQALMLVVDHGGMTLLARIGINRALHRSVERVFTDRKDHHWESGSWREIGDYCVRLCHQQTCHLFGALPNTRPTRVDSREPLQLEKVSISLIFLRSG
jgi:hypothetical protein